MAVAGSGGTAFLLLLAALLVGPLPAQAAAPATLLRLAQLTPDPPSVELTVSSVADPRKSASTATLHYGEMTTYMAVEPGDYVVTMRPAGSTAPPLVSRALSVRRGAAYTVASVRHTKTPNDLATFTDDLTPPQHGGARLRVINGAPPAEELDVQPVASGLPNGQASPYRDVVSGTVDLSVGPPGAPSTPLPVTVAPNQVASVVLTSDGGSPRATLVVDAGGPASVPPGPVHAGFGGTAGPAPGAAVGSGVLAVLAALAAGVSVRLARRAA